MTKTTVYLDADLAVTLRQIAALEGRAQAELIREALAEYARRKQRPAIPGLGEFDSGHTDTSQKAEQILRRAAGRADSSIQHGELRLDPVTHTVERAGVPVNLSAHEYSVLEALLQRPGAVLSRHQLENRLYGWNEPIGSNAVEVYIHGLRRKLGSEVIRTLRGVGYCVPVL